MSLGYHRGIINFYNLHYWKYFLPLTKEEIEYALNKRKNSETPGNGGVLAEMLKQGRHALLSHRVILLNNCVDEEDVLDDWSNTIVILIYKKGNIEDLEKYRSINMPSQKYQLFLWIIVNHVIFNLSNTNQIRRLVPEKGIVQ